MADFFDKVVVGINKGISTVSEGSKSVVEKAKTNVQIQDIEKKRAQLIQNLGALTFNLINEGSLDLPQGEVMYQEITNLNQKIAELQEQMKAKEEQKVQAPVAPVANGVVCTCGHQNKEGARFCSKCGTPL